VTSQPEGRVSVRRASRLVFDWLIFIVGLGGLVWYLSKFSNEFGRLGSLSVGAVVVLSAVVLVGHVVIAGKLLTSVGIFGARISLWEALLLVESGSFLNILPLNLGTALRARYLKKVARLKYMNYGLGFAMTQATGFLAAGVLGLAFLYLISGTLRSLQLVFLGYIAFSMAIVIIGYLVRMTGLVGACARGRRSKFQRDLLESLESGIGKIATHPGTVVMWFGFDLLSNLVLGIRFLMISMYLGYGLDLAHAMVMQGITRVSAVLTIVPSGTIGIREALTGVAAASLGQAAVTGVMIGTIDRIIATSWIVFLGSIASIVVRRRIARAELQGSRI